MSGKELKECVNCPGAVDHSTAECPLRASLPVGVPDGWKLVPVEPTPEMVSAAEEAHMPFGDMDIALRMAILSAPAAQPAAVTPEFVWLRLLEAMSCDNGCAFTSSTDDYREAKPAIIALIAAGFFASNYDDLDGDIWMVAAGEQGEASARFEGHASAYVMLSNVLNRVFEQPAAPDDDQDYERNAERLTAEAMGTGSGINMSATSVDELFDEPAAERKCITCQDSGIVGHSDICPQCETTWQPAAEQSAPGEVEYSTTSDQYRAELYDEVWQRARDMGYCNVTDALAALAQLAARDAVVVRVPVELLTKLVRTYDNSVIDAAHWTDMDGEIEKLRALLAQRERGGEA